MSTAPISTAKNEMLEAVLELFSRKHPEVDNDLTVCVSKCHKFDLADMFRPSHHIEIYSHEGTKYNHVPPNNLKEGTVEMFLEFFRDQKWINAASHEKRQLELRFVYNEEDIVCRT